MPNKIDLSGRTYGLLHVLREDPIRRNKRTFWICRCECGNERSVPLGDLQSGHTKSCGCLKIITGYSSNKTHGHSCGGSVSPEYRAWTAIKTRCYNQKVQCYTYYGLRGISVCERWLNSFENFYSDMGPRPSAFHSIERDDYNGNYEPSNCYWATKNIQARNKRNNRLLKHEGITLLLCDWAKKLKVHPSYIIAMLKRGKPFDEIVIFYCNKKSIHL